MTQFSSTPQLKDQILRAVQMEQLVGEEVTLQKRGNRLTGLCPFHDEKSPSFYIFDDHYHCFGCGAHGDAISYVQAQQGLGFIDALKWLGRRFGVDVTALDRSEKKIGEWRRRTQLAKLIVDAHDFFRAKLASAQGEEARAYLRERGLSVEVCERFGVGYAPDHARELYQFLSARGASAADLSEVSLVQQYRDSYFDFYRHRVMIPIRDIQGRIVAFGGRALGGQTVKYKNSRFEKGEILFGMDQARKQMRTAGFALVVEGYFDVIAMHQAGFSQTVAVQGTALTRSHLRSLASATPRVVLLFDGDKAGAAAALKVVEASLEVGGLQVQVVRLPEGEDPDSYVRKYGPQGMSQLLEHAVDLVEFAITQVMRESQGVQTVHVVEKQIVPWLGKIRDPLRLSFLVNRVAEISGVAAPAIQACLQGGSATAKPTPVDPRVSASPQEQSVEAVVVEAMPWQQLEPAVREWIGYLLFTPAGEAHIHLPVRQKFKARMLKLDTVWNLFVDEIFEKIVEGVCPEQVSAACWVSLESAAIQDFFRYTLEHKGAFWTDSVPQSLERIERAVEIKSLESQLNAVKSLLTSPQESLDSAARQECQQEFMHLCGRLRELHTQQRL